MYSCIDCGHLDKTRKKEGTGDNYNYGCNAHKNGYTCGWISKDSDLKWQGCSMWTEETHSRQMSIFEMIGA